MKKIIVICLGILFFSLSNENASARPASEADYRIPLANGGVCLIWSSGSSTPGQWVSVGGKRLEDGSIIPAGSYHCASIGNDCYHHDWRRDFTGIQLSDPSNPLQSSNEIMNHLQNNYPETLDFNYGYNMSNDYQTENGGEPLPPPNEDMQRFVTYKYDDFIFWWNW